MTTLEAWHKETQLKMSMKRIFFQQIKKVVKIDKDATKNKAIDEPDKDIYNVTLYQYFYPSANLSVRIF